MALSDLISEINSTAEQSTLKADQADSLNRFLVEMQSLDWTVEPRYYFQCFPQVTEGLKNDFEYAVSHLGDRLNEIANQSNRLVVIFESGAVDKSHAQSHARTQLGESLASWFRFDSGPEGCAILDAVLASACAWCILQATFNSPGDLVERVERSSRTTGICLALLAYWGASREREQIRIQS